MTHYNLNFHQGIHHYLNLIHKHGHLQCMWVCYTTIKNTIDNYKHLSKRICTLTVQLSALHMHGAVLGPLHTVRTALLLVSLHKQLAVESHIIITILID